MPTTIPVHAVLVAMPEELGPLVERTVGRRRALGLELLELELDGARALACVGGVGKVRAAAATAALLSAGADAGLLIVGVCGGLRRGLQVGTLVHCERVQADFAVRADRACEPDPALSAAWAAEVAGERGWFLTADRPALSLWRRLRLARAFAGAAVVDMETAAAAAVAARAGVPWAALRAVSDALALGGVRAFRASFPAQAGRAAATVPGLLARLARGTGVPRGERAR